ncbi:uncharacterized protein LOC117318263 [Pecten maximus]|uniref:uncharacterized protein LOC117318263 n=1 Tax=Pecten maximus TaxID=6579 RepID=UPI001458AC6B|nr:uncharacterized protein LOC117318263 [Pecten maximus]
MDDRKDTTVVLGMRYAEPKGMVGNIALMKPTLQGTFRPALAGSLTSEYAVDGHRWPGILQRPTLCSVSKRKDNAPYWQVDLQQSYVIHMVTVLIISTGRIDTVTIDIIDSDGRTLECTSHPGPGVRNTFKDIPCHVPTQGQTVRISKNETILTLCEVEIYGTYP